MNHRKEQESVRQNKQEESGVTPRALEPSCVPEDLTSDRSKPSGVQSGGGHALTV